MRNFMIFFIAFLLGMLTFTYRVEARIELVFLVQKSPDMVLFVRQFQKSIQSVPPAFDKNTCRIALVAWERDGISYASTYASAYCEYLPLYETEKADFENMAAIKKAARQMATLSILWASIINNFCLAEREFSFSPEYPWQKKGRH